MRSLIIAINYELCFVNDEKYRKHEKNFFCLFQLVSKEFDELM